jgi:hypothetical protein
MYFQFYMYITVSNENSSDGDEILTKAEYGANEFYCGGTTTFNGP